MKVLSLTEPNNTLIKDNKVNLEDLKVEYDKLQNKYGAKELDPIYNGGCTKNPDICFVFMNPTGRNIASPKTWKGLKAPWLGTKNIWKLFTAINLFDKSLLDEINEKLKHEKNILKEKMLKICKKMNTFMLIFQKQMHFSLMFQFLL